MRNQGCRITPLGFTHVMVEMFDRWSPLHPWVCGPDCVGERRLGPLPSLAPRRPSATSLSARWARTGEATNRIGIWDRLYMSAVSRTREFRGAGGWIESCSEVRKRSREDIEPGSIDRGSVSSVDRDLLNISYRGAHKDGRPTFHVSYNRLTFRVNSQSENDCGPRTSDPAECHLGPPAQAVNPAGYLQSPHPGGRKGPNRTTAPKGRTSGQGS
jgi:hypothetical protein